MAGYDRTGRGDAESDHPLGAFWQALRSHPAVAALVMLATLGSCLAWLSVRTPTYRARAQVLVNPRPPDDRTFLGLSAIKDTGDPTRTIQTAAALLDSPDAARRAGRMVQPRLSADEVLSAVDILPQGESNILDVVATASTPHDAVVLADAFVRATLDQRNVTLRQQVDPAIERLEAERADLAPGDDVTLADISSRLTQLRELRSQGDPTVELARRATAPAGAEGAPASLVVLLALVAGAVLAAVVAFLIDLLAPQRVMTEFQLSHLTRTPVLARVPTLPRWSWRGRGRKPPPLGRASLEAFRTLRLQLELTSESEPRVVMLTSPSRSNGKTTSVVQFAQTLAAAGKRALIVDLEFGRPGLPQLLGASPDEDVVTLRSGGRPWRDGVVEAPGAPGVALLVAARDASGVNADELVGPLEELFLDALEDFDYVLVDTPPLVEMSYALKLAFSADALLLVARLGSTTVADLEIAGDLLDRTGRHTAGLIVVA